MIYITYAISVISVSLAFILPIHKSFFLAVFLMPFVAFSVYVGVSVTVSQLVTIVVLLRMLPHARLTQAAMTTFLPLIIFVLWGYVVAYLTLEVNAENFSVIDGSFFRNGWGRVLAQTVVFALTFGLLYVFMTAKPSIDSRSVAISLLRACIVLVAIGYTQIFIFLVFETNVLPIGVFSDEFTNATRAEAILNTPLGPLLRMSSLGGEPKALAMSLVIACSVLIGFWRFIPRNRKWKALVLTFLLSGIVLTGSTSGFFSMLIAGSVMSIGLYIRRPLRTTTCVFFAMCISLANYGLYFGIVNWAERINTQNTARDDSLIGLFSQRTINRLGLDDTDTVIINSLAADPLQAIIGKGMGLSHIGADMFLSDYYIRRGYYYGQIINAKSGLTNYGGMTGVFGLILLSTFFGMLIGASSRTALPSEKSRRRQAAVLQMLAFSLFAVMLNRLYAANVAWLFISISGYTVNMLLRAQNSTTAFQARVVRPTVARPPLASSRPTAPPVR